MTAAALDLRDKAGLFGWQIHADDSRHEDTFIHGQHMVAVNYRRDGSVEVGRRYEFAKITEPHLCETTGTKNKKSKVTDWLIRLGH